MTLEEVRAKLARRASRAVVGGFRPPDSPLASWFGDVKVATPDEEWPRHDGKAMLPLCQLNLTEAPYVPDGLAGIALLTLFIDADEMPVENPNGDGWLIRTYETTNALGPLARPDDLESFLKPFPINWEEVAEDYPSWEDATDFIQDNAPELDGPYCDLFKAQPGTKLGGWPYVVQWSVGGHLLQIGTEVKANWMWGDSGVGYIGRDSGTGDWWLTWQCY